MREKDYHLFILWSNGRVKEEFVINELKKELQIVIISEIRWSEEFKKDNISRLYHALRSKNSEKLDFAGNDDFLSIIAIDTNPEYKFVQSLDGTIEWSNAKVAKLKQRIRVILGNNYFHSSSTPEEFYFQSGLLYSPEYLRKILHNPKWNGEIETLKRDLIGSDGYKNLDELFETLNFCTEYVVLRNFEFLPSNFWENDSDIDFLASNLKDFTAIANAQKRGSAISAYSITVSNKEIPIDVRFLGDGYYDPLWQQSILGTKIYNNEIIARPDDSNYYFSLLYHARLQKPSIKTSYVETLEHLGKKIGIESFDILSDEASASMLDGFLRGQNYKYVIPLDDRVFVNKNVLKLVIRCFVWVSNNSSHNSSLG